MANQAPASIRDNLKHHEQLDSEEAWVTWSDTDVGNPAFVTIDIDREPEKPPKVCPIPPAPPVLRHVTKQPTSRIHITVEQNVEKRASLEVPQTPPMHIGPPHKIHVETCEEKFWSWCGHCCPWSSPKAQHMSEE